MICLYIVLIRPGPHFGGFEREHSVQNYTWQNADYLSNLCIQANLFGTELVIVLLLVSVLLYCSFVSLFHAIARGGVFLNRQR